MKTSTRLSALLLVLILAASAWAQDEAEDQSGDVAEAASEDLAQEIQDQETQDQDAESSPEQSAEEAQDQNAGQALEAGEPQAPAEMAQAANGEQASAPVEAAAAGAETFVFQAHPNFSPDTAELVYRPLVNYLNAALPYRFDLALAPDYHRYWLSARRGENPHLVLEEPHLTAFRMAQFDYTPLVRADESLTYSLLTSMNNADSSVRDFIGRRISTMPAPSLGYLILASWFENPMQQPLIQSNAASWLDAVEIVFSQEADAAVVPNNLVSRYVNMANVLTSQEFPGVTISASPEVPADIQEEIRAALLALHEDEEYFVALNELDIDQFIEAQPAQYEGLEEWLSLVYSIL